MTNAITITARAANGNVVTYSVALDERVMGIDAGARIIMARSTKDAEEINNELKAWGIPPEQAVAV